MFFVFFFLPHSWFMVCKALLLAAFFTMNSKLSLVHFLKSSIVSSQLTNTVFTLLPVCFFRVSLHVLPHQMPLGVQCDIRTSAGFSQSCTLVIIPLVLGIQKSLQLIGEHLLWILSSELKLFSFKLLQAWEFNILLDINCVNTQTCFLY